MTDTRTKYKLNQLIREGGPKGPISQIVGFKDNYYIVKSLNGMATGYITEDYLYPYKNYEQLTLF